jgi:hypothetical protein
MLPLPAELGRRSRCLIRPHGLVPRPIGGHDSRRRFPAAGDRSEVPRRVKDFIDISEFTSLEDLIRYLETIRDNLPADHQAELKIRGDEVFGRRLTITYFREQTAEEAELDSKYSASDKDSSTIEDLRRKLDEVPYKLGKANGA